MLFIDKIVLVLSFLNVGPISYGLVGTRKANSGVLESVLIFELFMQTLGVLLACFDTLFIDKIVLVLSFLNVSPISYGLVGTRKANSGVLESVLIFVIFMQELNHNISMDQKAAIIISPPPFPFIVFPFLFLSLIGSLYLTLEVIIIHAGLENKRS